MKIIEWRAYESKGPLSWLIGRRSNAAQGRYTHIDVLDPVTGWLWGAHADSMLLATQLPKAYNLERTPKGIRIPSGFYPRPPNYQAKHWKRVTALRLPVSDNQFERFWDFTENQWAVPYDSRGLIETYVLGRNWRDPDSWYCSEEQARGCEVSGIFAPLDEDAVDPADFVELIVQTGASKADLPIPCPAA